MPTLTSYSTTPPSQILSQILELTRRNAVDLLADDVPPRNLWFSYLSMIQKAEVLFFLSKVGSIAGLIVATEGEAVTGFVMHLHHINNPSGTSINYLVVDSTSRGQGIARLLVNEVRAQRPVVFLDCKIAKVPFFQRLGFVVWGSSFAHVVMSTVAGQEDGEIIKANMADIQRKPQIAAHKAAMARQYGPKAMNKAIQAIKSRNADRQQQAETFYANYQAQDAQATQADAT